MAMKLRNRRLENTATGQEQRNRGIPQQSFCLADFRDAYERCLQELARKEDEAFKALEGFVLEEDDPVDPGELDSEDDDELKTEDRVGGCASSGGQVVLESPFAEESFEICAVQQEGRLRFFVPEGLESFFYSPRTGGPILQDDQMQSRYGIYCAIAEWLNENFGNLTGLAQLPLSGRQLLKQKDFLKWCEEKKRLGKVGKSSLSAVLQDGYVTESGYAIPLRGGIFNSKSSIQS